MPPTKSQDQRLQEIENGLFILAELVEGLHGEKPRLMAVRDRFRPSVASASVEEPETEQRGQVPA